MKKIFLPSFIVFSFICLSTRSQDLEKTAFEYFQGVKSATAKHQDLWDTNLYGPMILIDPATRKVYASEQDTLGELKPSNSIFVGTFPKRINISGAYVDWNGKTWAMLPFPFPESITSTDAIGLLCHELFHASQKRLGFILPNDELNNHLDSKEGRISLRLEFEALRKAIEATGNKEMENHLKNALIFRISRHNLFPLSRERENLLELNEGITQYTTVILRGSSKIETIANLKKEAEMIINGPTYMRTFAYHTIPAYGYLLQERKKYWNKEISMQTNLTDFFTKEFGISLPENIEEAYKQIRNEYYGEKITTEEEDRESKNLTEKKLLIKTLISDPHLEIAIRGQNMSFNPGNVTLLEGLGTVYKGNVRWSDKWGVLEVLSGLFLSDDGGKISVSFPQAVEHLNAKGNGWELWLNEGYQFVKDDSGNYTINQRRATSVER